MFTELRAIAIILLILMSLRFAAAQVVYDPMLNLVCEQDVFFPTPAAQGKRGDPMDSWGRVCRMMDACVASGIEDGVCQLRIAVDGLEDCGDDLMCQARAIIYASGVNVDYEFTFADNEEVAHILRTSLLQLENGRPLQAAEALLQYPQREAMMTLSAAAAMRAAGLLPEAIEITAQALWYDIDHVLVNYFAALALGETGDTTRAAHLAYTLGRVLEMDPVLDPVVIALQSAYPLDLTEFEPWLLYGFYRRGAGPGGGSYQDMHRLPPVPVRVQRADSGSLTLLDYPFSEALFSIHPEAYVAYFPPDETMMTHNQVWSGVELRVDPIEAGYLVYEQSREGEWIISTVRLLVSPDNSDPFVGVQPIDCGLLHWLTAGQRVTSSFVGVSDALTVYTEPNGAELAAVGEVTLQQQSRCVGMTLWWQVRVRDEDGGGIGWLPINEGTIISLETDSGINGPLYCPFALPTRLGWQPSRVIADAGIVLRAAAGRDGEIIAMLPILTETYPRSGPDCVENAVWWLLRVDGVEGWAAEGTVDTYWLEPLPED